MTRFSHFDKKIQVFGNLFEGLFNIGQNFESTLAKHLWLLGHVFNVLNGQLFNRYYSHLVILINTTTTEYYMSFLSFHVFDSFYISSFYIFVRVFSLFHF